MAGLETAKLVIRPATLDDAPFFLGLLNQPSFIANIGDRGVRTLEDARRYIADGPLRSHARSGFGLDVVILKATGESIGICGLIRRETLADVDIGYAFLPAFWSNGYAYEAAAAILAEGRAVHRLARVVAIVNPANARSIRLLEKLGMAFERLIRLAPDADEVALYGVGQIVR